MAALNVSPYFIIVRIISFGIHEVILVYFEYTVPPADLLEGVSCGTLIIEAPHDKTNKMACAPSEDSDQPGHPPSLIRVFAVRSVGSQGPQLSSYG